MRKQLLAVAFVLGSAITALSQTTDPMAAVHQYIDSFNKGDAKGMAAACANPVSILDGMAPHSWAGPTACEDWYKDVLAEGEREDASGYVVTLGKPRHLNVNGDAAYVVLPATMTFKHKGKQVTQTGATWTLALRKFDDSWRITAWAWSKGGGGGH
jgi:ketosteroid isomerase-like protein